MAVVSCRELPEREASLDDRGVLRYRRSWRVIVDQPTDGPGVVVSPSEIPRIFAPHPEVPLATCRKVVPRWENRTRWWWIVEAEYSTEYNVRDRGAGNDDADPFSWEAEIEWDGANQRVPFVRDVNGDPVVNSAGDPPEGLEIDQGYQVVRVRKPVPGVPAWLLDFENAVNSDSFELDGFPIEVGVARCYPPKIAKWERHKSGVRYRWLTLELHLKRDGWDVEFLDEGFYEFETDERRGKRLIVDDSGDPVSKPVLLDGRGRKVSAEFLAQVLETTGSNFNGIFRRYRGYEWRAFSDLPLA